MKKKEEVKKEAIEEQTLLSALCQIVELSEDSKLSDAFFKLADQPVQYICRRQEVTPMQAVFLALSVNFGSDGPFELEDITEHLSCNNIQFLAHKSEFEALQKRWILFRNNEFGGVKYRVNRNLFEKYKDNEPFVMRGRENLNSLEFFDRVYQVTHHLFEKEITHEMAYDEIKALMEANPQLRYIRELKKLKLDDMDALLLTHFCRHLVLHNEFFLEKENILFLIDTGWKRSSVVREFSQGRHHLMNRGLITFGGENGLRNTRQYCLTKKAIKRLLAEFKIDAISDETPDEVIKGDKIVNKEMFYDDRVSEDIQRLTSLLQPANYKGIHERMLKKGMRCGFACLFYGAPGTGKTETVLQLARQTGRDIIQVNISEVKSMWVGESEKNVKAIFERYRKLVKVSANTPILLFNEADAIIGKRRTNVSHSVDSMENTMQNIILQEMETLDGIMIATTNLADNMDKAFERRFLYKVRFDSPSKEARRHIWKSILPQLSEQLIAQLSDKYDLSGGQIENIARKYDVDSILYGEDQIDSRRIESYCQAEQISQQHSSIGFRV